MTYQLGIDLGTTYTAAAVCRVGAHGRAEPEIVPLGSQSAAVASVLYLGADDAVLVGEAAERRALTEPDRVVRQFKRRIGDDVPLVVGDAVHSAHDLAARLARWVVDRVAEREGGPAARIAVTHPASWGEHKRDLLAGALRGVGLDGVTFLPEPQAAAVAYAGKQRVEAGSAVAVYDLGGGTFDAAVVRKTTAGFELPGRPEGLEQLGGVDFDDRVFDHVRAALGAAFDALDPEDDDVVSAVARLRRECVEAKEALSFDTEVTIPVVLPSLRTNVRMVRVEFESMIRSSLDHTVDALRRTLETADLTPEQLSAVLLVGGSSRIPLVAQMVSEELGRPVAVDADPKTSIALGAALAVTPRPSATGTGAGRSIPALAGAAAAAMTTTLGRGDGSDSTSLLAGGTGEQGVTGGSGSAVSGPSSRSGPSSGLIDLSAVSSAGSSTRSAGSAAAPSTPAPSGSGRSTSAPSGIGPSASAASAPARPRTGPVPQSTPPASGRFPAAPPSGRFPAAPHTGRTGPVPSGSFPAPPPPSGRFGAVHAGPSSPPHGMPRTGPAAGVPPRPPVRRGDEFGTASSPETAPDEAATRRPRTRLLVVAGAIVLLAAATTGGVVYARSGAVASTSTVPPAPVSAVVAPPPVPVTTEAAADDPEPGSSGGSGAASGGSAGTGSRNTGGGTGGSRGGTGSHTGGTHGSEHGTTPEGTPPPEPSSVPVPTPRSTSAN